MEALITQLINSYGYFGIFFLIFIENIFPPIPSELILTFAGYLTSASQLTILGVIFFSTMGSLLGAFALYFIGKLLDKERLIKIVKSKHMKFLKIKPRDIEKADKWFDEKGNITVFFCRFIPVVRSLISIPAGMSSMSIPKFTLYTFSGSLIWNTILIYVGAYAGDKKEQILFILNQFENVIIIAGILFSFLIIIYIIKNNKERKIFGIFKIKR